MIELDVELKGVEFENYGVRKPLRDASTCHINMWPQAGRRDDAAFVRGDPSKPDVWARVCAYDATRSAEDVLVVSLEVESETDAVRLKGWVDAERRWCLHWHTCEGYSKCPPRYFYIEACRPT